MFEQIFNLYNVVLRAATAQIEKIKQSGLVENADSLSEDLSMMYALDLKMDIVFNLTQQYNNGVPFIPITADNLISKYNINENVAQRLASEINTMLENYVQEKKFQKENYKPFILDEIEETESIGEKSR